MSLTRRVRKLEEQVGDSDELAEVYEVGYAFLLEQLRARGIERIVEDVDGEHDSAAHDQTIAILSIIRDLREGVLEPPDGIDFAVVFDQTDGGMRIEPIAAQRTHFA